MKSVYICVYLWQKFLVLLFPPSTSTRASAPIGPTVTRSARAKSHHTPDNRYLQIPDFLAQRIAVKPQHRRRLDLVAPGRGQRHADQRTFHLRDDLVIHA